MTFEIILAAASAVATGCASVFWNANGAANTLIKVGMVVVSLANVLELCHLLKF